MATPRTPAIKRIPQSNNLPLHRNPPPPPPLKKQLWKRYAAGEKLQPTYKPLFKPSRIPDPPPTEPRIIKTGNISTFEIMMFLILVFVMIVIGCVYSLT